MTDLVTLSCPSCGSPLDTPDGQGVIRCRSCNTKVILTQSESRKESRDISRLQELSKVAKVAKNYRDLLKYTNELLEFDPKNTDGWINKAIATASLSNEGSDRFEEAMGYLQQASQLSPSDNRITEAQINLIQLQFQWYQQLAREKNIQAANMLRTGMSGRSYGVTYTIEAMNYYIKALRIKPDDIDTLKSMKLTADAGKMLTINWSDEVKMRLNSVERLDSKKTALQRLPMWQAKLKELEDELVKVKRKNGFFARLDLEDVQKEIKRVTTEINRLQTEANFEITK